MSSNYFSGHQMNLPNLLTLSRLVLIPAIIVAFFTTGDWGGFFAGVLFGIASATDFLDGYLARRWNQTSKLGAFLDPVVDKLTVSTSLIVLVSAYNGNWWVFLCTLIIISREITISALREWMAGVGARDVVAVDHTGKWKTTLQMLAIGFLYGACTSYFNWAYIPGLVMLVLATALTLYSMVNYLVKAFKAIDL